MCVFELVHAALYGLLALEVVAVASAVGHELLHLGMSRPSCAVVGTGQVDQCPIGWLTKVGSLLEETQHYGPADTVEVG